jgi:hypothetical protein
VTPVVEVALTQFGLLVLALALVFGVTNPA